MATNQTDSDYPAMRERPPVDPHTYRYILPPPYPDNPEAVQQYNAVDQFLARLKAIFENDHPAIHARLEEVAQVLDEVYTHSPEAVSWAKLNLQDAMDRITRMVEVLKIDAIPGAKQRSGRSLGGTTRSKDIRDKRHAQWQKDAEDLVKDIRFKGDRKTSTSVKHMSILLERKYRRDYREACILRDQGKRNDQDVEEKQCYLASRHTIRKYIHKT